MQAVALPSTAQAVALSFIAVALLPPDELLISRAVSRCAAAHWNIMLRIMLPSMLYRLLPCSFTAWLALASLCDEPHSKDLELVLLEWR